MADVLSQSQIDALLKSMSADAPAQETKTESVQPLSPEEKNYIKYDFFSPRKFTKEKMKILRSVFENYARILTSQINGIFRVMTDITVLDVQERRYYEYVNALHENDCYNIFAPQHMVDQCDHHTRSYKQHQWNTHFFFSCY